MNELRPHHQVVVEELRRVLTVRANAADLGRQMNDDVGPRRIVEPANGGSVGQVELTASRDRDIARALRLHAVDHIGTQKTSAARYTDAPI